MRKLFFIILCSTFSNLTFGQDSLFTYKKDNAEIHKYYWFYPNGKTKMTYNSTSSIRPMYEFPKRQDLLLFEVKYDANDSTLVYGTIRDSIVHYRTDERVDSKQYFKISNGDESMFYAHYVYNEHKSLVRVDTQYSRLEHQYATLSKNILTLKSRPDKYIRGNEKLPITKIGHIVKVPLLINSKLNEPVSITINTSRFLRDIYVSDAHFGLNPNEDGSIFLEFLVHNTDETYSLNLKVQSHKETYNIDFNYHVKGFHFSEDYLKEAVGITHENNQELAIKFNNNNQRSIKIYKGKEVVLEKQSTEDYALLRIYKLEKGDYTLEITDEVTKEKINPLLILK